MFVEDMSSNLCFSQVQISRLTFYIHLWTIYWLSLVCQNPHWWSPIITSTDGYWIIFCMQLETVICLDNPYISSVLLVYCYNNGLLPLLRQFSFRTALTNLWLWDGNCSNQLCSWFIPHQLCTAISTSTGLGSGSNGSAVCISICFTPLTLWEM
jgi:hypothetical protein